MFVFTKNKKMDKPTYMIIKTDPDGDSYQIHQELEKARKSFVDSKDSATIWGEGTLYLVEVENLSDFGFGSQGDFYGGEILEEHNFQDDGE